MDFDPNAPAFGPSAQQVEEPKQTEAKTEVKAEETEKESVKGEGEKNKVEETSEEESKVPYSRFKKFHDEAKQRRLEAEEWRQKYEEATQRTSKDKVEDDLPDFWKELYGDSDASKKAWKIQSQANKQLVEQARQEALEAVRAEARAEEQRVEKNLETIDERLDDLTDVAGRELTEKEQEAVLDIVDEFSPKDEDGNYEAMIPFEKAWSIYEMRTEQAKASKIASKNKVASITNSKSQGESSVDTEKDRNFNPLDWDAWKKRI